MSYDFKAIEQKWQNYWSENQTFKAESKSEKPKYYVLDMFPYPSGAGLHVGHPLGYIASDIFSRYKRLKGFNVLHPIGYDSFGLPAEQYAILTGQHPATTTKMNIEGGIDAMGNEVPGYENQMKRLGLSFDWSTEIRTSSPEYYKWTQWIFTELFNAWYNKETNKAENINSLISAFENNGNIDVKADGQEDINLFTAEQWKAYDAKTKEEVLVQYRLTYLAETEVNWCAELGTVLANDEIVNGLSERGSHPVVRKKMMQWSMRISAYANRLLMGLDSLDWTEAIKESQRNWIGKSKGASVSFKVAEDKGIIDVFTTRPDTIFGVSFMTLAPEHELVNEIVTPEQKQAVDQYILETSKRSERDRIADVKRISGVFTGAYAVHPFTNENIPIWIGDYVLAGYGTGAVMAVPSGDQRDYDFAKHFDIEIKNIFEDIDLSENAYTDKKALLKNSDFLNGLSIKKATGAVIKALQEKEIGKGKTNFKLRDAVFSRQRYWGEPFPVYYKDGSPQMIAKQHLPIVLPKVDEYLPTSSGEPPLGRAKVWAWDTVNNKVVSNDAIDNSSVFPLELNTMPGWAGSSWYFNRYMDPNNTEEFASKDSLEYWQNVDLYIGGSEHATGHLLYARFWQKFLFDLGYLPSEKFATKLINQGMILGHSAFVYKIKETNTYVSVGLKDQYETTAHNVNINLLEGDVLDTEKLKKWLPSYANAEFVLEDGKYICGREVEKMSKSKHNVLNPDDICQKYGADTLRLYEMFLGPLEQSKPWNTQGLSGVHSFMKKLYRLYKDDNGSILVEDTEASKEEMKILHQTIKKVDADINNFSFNTSVSTFMILVNELTKLKSNNKSVLTELAKLISPYAPHIAEELWEILGNENSISYAGFPVFDAKWLVESEKEYPVSFNGKMRFKLKLSLDLSKEEIEKIIMADERTIKQLDGRSPKKVIIVPGKIINLVG